MRLPLHLQVIVSDLIMITIITHQRAVAADTETDIIHQHQGKYNSIKELIHRKCSYPL